MTLNIKHLLGIDTTEKISTGINFPDVLGD
jgi:hypothetical protein